MKSRIAGQLHPIDYDPDFFESEPYPIPYFNNKELKVGFREAAHSPYLIEADDVLEKFLKLNDTHRVLDSEMVYRYYSETLKFGHTNDLNIKMVYEIWKFVYPLEIIIHWDENADFYLCVTCGCDWEEEHGLQLVFKNGENLTRASGHDGGFSDE